MHTNHTPERLTPVAVSTSGNKTSVTTFGGYSIREAAGSAAAAAVNIRKGVQAADNSGDLLCVVELAANESATWNPPVPLRGDSTYGIYWEVVSGTVTGVVYLWS